MRVKAICTLVLVVALVGCGPTATQPAPSGWNVVLTGRGSHDALHGTAGVASQFGATQLHIELRGPAGGVYSWRLVRGTCSAPGAGIGATAQYPELRLSGQGRTAAQAHLNQMLDPDGAYALVVHIGTEDIAACGDLEPQRFSGTIPAGTSMAPDALAFIARNRGPAV